MWLLSENEEWQDPFRKSVIWLALRTEPSEEREPGDCGRGHGWALKWRTFWERRDSSSSLQRQDWALKRDSSWGVIPWSRQKRWQPIWTMNGNAGKEESLEKSPEQWKISDFYKMGRKDFRKHDSIIYTLHENEAGMKSGMGQDYKAGTIGPQQSTVSCLSEILLQPVFN